MSNLWDDDYGNQEATAIEDVRAVRETEKALLCRIPDDREEGGYREVWIPKSQILTESDVSESDDEGTLVVTSWFARKEELVDG